MKLQHSFLPHIEAATAATALRWVIGWTYFSAFWRRTALAVKLDPDAAGYIGEKFNHFLPNALGIGPLIEYLVLNPDVLHIAMVLFTIIEGIVGLFLILGLFTRLMSIGVVGLAMGILLGSGWIGTTCLDEWQIGVLGVAGGFILLLIGSGKFSLDSLFFSKGFAFTQTNRFRWFASGELPLSKSVLNKIALGGAAVALALTLFTNQYFHGGVWGTLHNKSVKPKIEIYDARLSENELEFEIYRVEGVDVYGSFLIDISLYGENNERLLHLNQTDLAGLPPRQIQNRYVAKVRPHKYSMVVPLGAKALIKLKHEINLDSKSKYFNLVLTDISGAEWEVKINYDK